MSGHDDEASDKKLFSKMLKKAMPQKKVTSHLKKDIHEQKKGVKEDRALLRSIKHSGRGR
jgi:hypothetical protein